MRQGSPNDENDSSFTMANDAYFYISSNLCKEVCRLGGDVSKLCRRRWTRGSPF